MTIETELETLVKLYATFDAEKKSYVSKLDSATLLRLDADFVRLINHQLLVDGPEKEPLLKNYRRITKYLHPDRTFLFLPEVIWLEQNLSQGQNDGICFKSLFTCYEKLTIPQKFKESTFADIKNGDDCRKWLEKLRNNAGTYTSRCFCDSLIGLFDQAGGFFDEVGQIQPRGLRALVAFMPMIFSSYGAIIFAEELFAVYALYFLILKGGQYLERSDLIEMKQLGKTLQEISVITATATTTLLVRLLEMTFWVSHRCYDASLFIGSAILKPLLSAPPKSNLQKEASTESKLCNDLIIASKNLSEGMQFKTPELKVVSAPLESYLGLNAQQFFGDWRIGRTKRLMVEAFLFRMRVLDAGSETTENKLIAAKKELEVIKKHTDVYAKGGKTAEAVDRAEQAITLLTGLDSQLVVYKK